MYTVNEGKYNFRNVLAMVLLGIMAYVPLIVAYLTCISDIVKVAYGLECMTIELQVSRIILVLATYGLFLINRHRLYELLEEEAE